MGGELEKNWKDMVRRKLNRNVLYREIIFNKSIYCIFNLCSYWHGFTTLSKEFTFSNINELYCEPGNIRELNSVKCSSSRELLFLGCWKKTSLKINVEAKEWMPEKLYIEETLLQKGRPPPSRRECEVGDIKSSKGRFV